MSLHKPNHDTFTHFVIFYDHETGRWGIEKSDTTARFPEGNTCSTNFDPVLCETEWFTNHVVNDNLFDELAGLLEVEYIN
jgi:hypothetical protein